MDHQRLLIFAVSLGCVTAALGCSPPHHRVAAAPTPSQSASPQAHEPQAAPRDHAREISGYVLDSLVHAGYRCNEDSVVFMCMNPNDTWVAQIATRVDGDRAYIMFDSFATRAPWLGCGQHASQLQALHSEPTYFYAQCNDSSQRIRFNTSLLYDPALKIPEWFAQHLQSRYDAFYAFEGLQTAPP